MGGGGGGGGGGGKRAMHPRCVRTFCLANAVGRRLSKATILIYIDSVA